MTLEGLFFSVHASLIHIFAQVYVNGDYVLQVRTHSYSNPNNRCAFCGTSLCCDFNFDNDRGATCSGSENCDNFFYYCLRAFQSTGERCAGGQFTPSFIRDGGPIDFNQDKVLGLANPLPLIGLSTAWSVSLFFNHAYASPCTYFL